jgi:O-antigen ligase
MLMGVLYLEWRYVNLKVLFLLSFIALIFAMMNTTAVSGFSQRVSTFFSFTDRGRGLDVGSGRYEALGIAIHDFWLPHFWLGIGPGQISVRGMTEYRNLSVDNAAIAYLSEVGILGAIPMFLLVVVVVKKAWMLRHDDRVIAATAILLANIVETGGESLLINMGNPGSLIFLWSIAAVMAVAAAQGEQVSAPELEFLPA